MTVNMTIDMTCEPHALRAVLQLLSQGGLMQVSVPATIRELLCSQLGISGEYVDKRINTLFLNGKAVDDVDSAVVRDRATLALSASMPGFVGAAFRRGGFYAAMRDNVSYVEGGAVEEAKRGLVMIKLFNMTCPELGPQLLASGIWLRGEDLDQFFAARPAAFWTGCRSIRVNSQEINAKDAQLRNWSQFQGFIRLKATASVPEDSKPE
jgi:hypothetical protein